MTDANQNSSLDRAAVATLVVTELAAILETSAEDILDDVPFKDLGADSLALIELVEALEENLAAQVPGFHIDDEDLETLTTVRDAVDYVAAKLNLS
jgi:acyl carrier protein